MKLRKSKKLMLKGNHSRSTGERILDFKLNIIVFAGFRRLKLVSLLFYFISFLHKFGYTSTELQLKFSRTLNSAIVSLEFKDVTKVKFNLIMKTNMSRDQEYKLVFILI